MKNWKVIFKFEVHVVSECVIYYFGLLILTLFIFFNAEKKMI